MTRQETVANPLQGVSDVLAGIAERVGNTVVGVHAGRRLPSSGFVWSDGIIVTAAHALRRGQDIGLLAGDGRTIDAEAAGEDPGTDLAVLRTKDLQVPPAARGDADALKPGHIVLALARLRVRHVSLDYGLVAAVGPAWRTWQGAEIDRFLALDGGLRPGFSGGPVVDAAGLVVGMGTAAFLRGTGTVIPRATVTRIVEELLTTGHVSRGYLGVALQAVELPTAAAAVAGGARRGLLVTAIDRDGPAERGGVMVGDILLELAHCSCQSPEDALRVLGASGAAQPLGAVLLRGGARMELTIALGERPQRRAC